MSTPQVKAESAEKLNPVKAQARAKTLSHKSPAVYLLKQLSGCWPNKVQEDVINTEISDMKKWETVLREWMLRGYSPKSVASMLDWYKNGIKKNGGTTAKNFLDNIGEHRRGSDYYRNTKHTVYNSGTTNEKTLQRTNN